MQNFPFFAVLLLLFKCFKFMKGRTSSTLSRTKYVKYFRVETSCYRVLLRLKFIVTVELLYDQAESDFPGGGGLPYETAGDARRLA